MSLVCSAALVMVWIVTGHWVLMDGMFTLTIVLTAQIVLLTPVSLPLPPKKGLPGKSKSTIQGQYGRVVRAPDSRGPKRVSHDQL